MSVDGRRVRELSTKPAGSGPVLYWMSRDQRVQQNWALLYAQNRAITKKVPLVVVFSLHRISARANTRQYEFMCAGLKEVCAKLDELKIPFYILHGKPEASLHDFVMQHNVGEVIVDFSPLRYARRRREAVADSLPVLLSEVDAHNIVPCWHASIKEEFAAYTFRPKIHRVLQEYLTPFPKLVEHPFAWIAPVPLIVWEDVIAGLELDMLSPAVIPAGTNAATKQLNNFITNQLEVYDELRNDPTKNAVSGLSPYLHFGQISAQGVALAVSQADLVSRHARDVFLEELIVRRELADNYCFYNKQYDRIAGAHAWAQKSLAEHATDQRQYVYVKKEFEDGLTHDDLWNAMQHQMVLEGKMHGWCRMYWAKKIMEWTPDIQTAIDIALSLNDKYELDGLDPNGVTGVMWSICGVHDRAWNEREIFGKVRYMNYAGAKRKFDIKAYIERYGRKETLFE